MIRLTLKKVDNDIQKIIIKGHALYDDYGKDIVCAAVSATVITSVNACLSIDDKSISYDDKSGVTIEVLNHDYVTMKILNNMINSLAELAKAYPKNIEIREENNE